MADFIDMLRTYGRLPFPTIQKSLEIAQERDILLKSKPEQAKVIEDMQKAQEKMQLSAKERQDLDMLHQKTAAQQQAHEETKQDLEEVKQAHEETKNSIKLLEQKLRKALMLLAAKEIQEKN